jgi:hypothetical protein
MLLGIAAELSAPPSSPTAWRDVTLWAKVYRRYDVLAICPYDEVDLWVPWLRRHGAFDFVDEILPREQAGTLSVEIEGGCGAKLTAHNLHHVLSLL